MKRRTAMGRVKIGLRVKFTALFLVLGILLTISVKELTYNACERAVTNKFGEDAANIAEYAGTLVDAKLIEKYSTNLKKDKQYKEIQDKLNTIKEKMNLVFLYIVKPSEDNKNEAMYIFDTWGKGKKDKDTGELGGIVPLPSESISIRKVLKTGNTNRQIEITSTQYGKLASTYAAIKDSDENVVALVGIDIKADAILETVTKNIEKMVTLVIIIIAFCFCLLLIMIQIGIISPIRVLKDRVEKMAEGELGIQVPLKGRNEITEISSIFNRMSFNIEGHMKEVDDLNKSCYKFVPLKVFELLKKRDIKEVKLGDHEEVHLELLGMQINDFNMITMEMNSKELFSFINTIYHLFVPLILEKDGVIERYENGGFDAFYMNIDHMALDSAINICHKLNEKRNDIEILKNLEIAFCLSEGNVMMGIVGHDERLSTAAISTQFRVVDHLKSVAAKYRSRIIITDTIAKHIPEFFESYHSRMLGIIYINETDHFETIYDVYDGDNEEERFLKEMTKNIFEEGVKCFISKSIKGARANFIKVLKINGMDYAAREYLYLCNQYSQLEESEELILYMEEI